MALEAPLHGEPARAEFPQLAGRLLRGSVNGGSINVGRHLVLLLPGPESTSGPDSGQGADEFHAALIERRVERIIRRNEDWEAVGMPQGVPDNLAVLAARHSGSVLT